jgi:hypothetical protein
MRRLVTILTAIGIVVLVATSAIGFGPWAPFTYWGGGYSSSSGGSYWPGYYDGAYLCMPVSSSSGTYYWPSSSSYSRVYYSYPDIGLYYWPSSSSSSSFKRYYY